MLLELPLAWIVVLNVGGWLAIQLALAIFLPQAVTLRQSIGQFLLDGHRRIHFVKHAGLQAGARC